MIIKVINPYYDKEYFTDDISEECWNNFLENHRRGNEEFIQFVDKKTGQTITINPAYFASVEVTKEGFRKNYRLFHKQKFNGQILEDSYIEYDATKAEMEEAVRITFSDPHVFSAWYEEVQE